MFCENCGAKLPENSKFCTKCGATSDGAASAKDPAASAPLPAAPVATPAPPQPPQPAYIQPQAQNSAPPAYTPPPQQNYNQPQNYGSVPANRQPLGIGSYIGMFILTAIPIVGFIMLMVWAFGGGVNLNKKNYARASLILSLIAIGISLMITLIIVVVGGTLFNSLTNSYYW